VAVRAILAAGGGTGSGGASAGESRQPVANTNGLVGWWKLDGNALDSSGNNNNGTLTNFTFDGTTNGWTAGKFGQGLRFNGTSNYVSPSSVSSITALGQFSYSVWVYPTAISQHSYSGGGWGGSIVGGSIDGASGYCIGIRDNGRIWWWPLGGGDKFSTSTVPLNTWTHVVVSYGAGTVAMYINGRLDSSQASAAPGIPSNIKVGGKSWITGYFQGGLDDVRIYNRALSAAEVQKLYLGSAPASCDQTCATYLKFDDASGSTASDSTGNGRAGTISGAATWTSGNFGSALGLNGTTNSVTVPNLGLARGTVETWINPSVITGDQRILSQASGTSTQAGALAMNQSSGESGSLWVWDGSAWQRLSASGALSAGTWNHVVVTYSGSSATAYVNGVRQLTATTGFAFSGVLASIGGPSWGTTGGYLSGGVDDFRVYSRILTDYEVADHYRAGL
jgi:hypothetical protein